MSNLVKINDGKLVTSSRQVAEVFERAHDNVLKAIRVILGDLSHSSKITSDFFIESEWKSTRGQKYPEYLMDRDGFTLLAMGFTGAKALEWKIKYIEAFNRMEKELTQPKKLSPMETLKLQFEVLDDHDKRLGNLEDNMTLDYSQQLKVQRKAKEVALRVLKGKDSNAYKDRSTSSKVFSAIWKDYKDYIGVASYKDTPRLDLEKGLSFLYTWNPSGRLLKEIENINNQERMLSSEY